MIRHCVFVKFRPEIGAEERQSILDQLAALKQKLDGILRFDAGPNVSTEGFGNGFDAVFIIDFRDVAARDAYLVAPEHGAAGARLVAALQGGTAGLMVFDLALA